jgi:hypothetical protein
MAIEGDDVALTVRAGWVRAMGVAGLLAVLWTATGAGGPRLMVEIDEPFVLQGQVCPAGTLSIRPVSQYNPASTFHEVCIENECLGVFPAERIAFETDDERDTLRFERDAGGMLVLVGYTLHRDGRAEFHRFAPSPNAPVHLLARRGHSGFSSKPDADGSSG